METTNTVSTNLSNTSSANNGTASFISNKVAQEQRFKPLVMYLLGSEETIQTKRR